MFPGVVTLAGPESGVFGAATAICGRSPHVASRQRRVGITRVTPSARDTARAMSEENVEVVRRLIDAWNGRDREAWMALAHPDVGVVLLRFSGR